MYCQPVFAEERRAVQHALMRAHPLATLIVSGGDGPSADLVPFLLYPDEGPCGTLRAHVARANPLWQALAGGAPCLVQFQGPQAYVSPSWYASKAVNHKVVPTWNYAVVQAHGVARVTTDPAWLLRQLGDLTAAQEGDMPAPWRIGDTPPGFVDGLLPALVGIELPVARLQGKWKVSQNRSDADRVGVAAGLDAEAAPMAALVRGLRPA